MLDDSHPNLEHSETTQHESKEKNNPTQQHRPSPDLNTIKAKQKEEKSDDKKASHTKPKLIVRFFRVWVKHWRNRTKAPRANLAEIIGVIVLGSIAAAQAVIYNQQKQIMERTASEQAFYARQTLDLQRRSTQQGARVVLTRRVGLYGLGDSEIRVKIWGVNRGIKEAQCVSVRWNVEFLKEPPIEYPDPSPDACSLTLIGGQQPLKPEKTRGVHWEDYLEPNKISDVPFVKQVSKDTYEDYIHNRMNLYAWGTINYKDPSEWSEPFCIYVTARDVLSTPAKDGWAGDPHDPKKDWHQCYPEE